jgi:hypothetical protein
VESNCQVNSCHFHASTYVKRIAFFGLFSCRGVISQRINSLQVTMWRPAVKAAFLTFIAVILASQLLTQNEILCRDQCNRQHINLAVKHACCPAVLTQKAAREKLRQNCPDCREIAPGPSAILEAQITCRIEPQAVSVVEIPGPIAITSGLLCSPLSRVKTSPVWSTIPIRLHRFLI